MELHKIADFIKKNKVTPKDVIYHTWRDGKNKKGEISGKIRIIVMKSDGIARVEYICPECGHYGYLETEWKRPFSFKCEKCGYRIRVPRLKDEVKKERKMEKKLKEKSKKKK